MFWKRSSDTLMARYDGRLVRLEKVARAASQENREGQALINPPLTESLEAAIGAAEFDTGLRILEVNPFTLSATVWTDLAAAILESDLEILRNM